MVLIAIWFADLLHLIFYGTETHKLNQKNYTEMRKSFGESGNEEIPSRSMVALPVILISSHDEDPVAEQPGCFATGFLPDNPLIQSMRWAQSEYLLKGVFLGLLLFVALDSQSWSETGQVGLYMAGGFGIGLLLAIIRQVRDLPRLLRRPFGFLVFVLLENPLLIYSGVILGLAFGAFQVFEKADTNRLLTCVIGGLVFGYSLEQLRRIPEWRYKLAGVILDGAIVIMLLDYWLGPDLSAERRQFIAFQLLLGLPFFYLLTFAGAVEESEAEIGAICIVIAVAIRWSILDEEVASACLLLPVRALLPLRHLRPPLAAHLQIRSPRLQLWRIEEVCGGSACIPEGAATRPEQLARQAGKRLAAYANPSLASRQDRRRHRSRP